MTSTHVFGGPVIGPSGDLCRLNACHSNFALTGYTRNRDKSSFIPGHTVGLMVRSNYTKDLTLGNKIIVQDLIDDGRIILYQGYEVKKILDAEVFLTSKKGGVIRVPNDYVFALIGGIRPNKFLKDLGIEIGGQGSTKAVDQMPRSRTLRAVTSGH